ncbi:uncharacterized protein LOC135350804 isoform X1 [Halichondria panicea]|uniref:uncharacterized protein LOC135350804 isoform X1 n=1 Tax=Halichondria panicea TaxID=6063 RepID=UPI00312BBA55
MAVNKQSRRAESLSITISNSAKKYSDFSHTEPQVQPNFSLSIPIELLHHWYMNKKAEETFISLVNSMVTIVKLAQSDLLEKRLAEQASKVARRIRGLKGRRRYAVLAGEYNLFVLDGEAESYSEIEQQLSTESPQPTTIPETSRPTTAHINKGKKVHEVSPRQVKRKLAHCKSSAEQALWFCESFGLQPESLELRKQTGSPIKFNFLSSPSHKPQHQTPALSPNDSARVQQALYVLDRFAVSDEAYHELSVASDLPPLYRIKDARLSINNSLDIRHLEGPYPGAYRPPKAAIQEELAKIVHSGKAITQPVKVKLSGDGARFTRSSNIILLSFAFPEIQDNVLSGMGKLNNKNIKRESGENIFILTFIQAIILLLA